MAAAGDASHGGTGARAGEASLLVALAAAALAALFLVDYLPTNDGPRHIFAIHAANHLDDVESGYGSFFEPSSPVTSLGFQTLFAPLESWLPWRTALTLAQGAMLLLWTLSAYAFARAVHPGRGWLGLALAAAAFQWSLYMGLFSFYIASGVGLVVLAVAFARSVWTVQRRAILCALLFAQALFHVAAAAATGIVLAILVLCRSPRSELAASLAWLAGIAAPAALVALSVAASGFEGLVAQSEAEGAARYESAPLWTLGRCFLGGPAWRAWPLTLLAAAAPVIAVATRGTGRRPEDRALVIAGSLLLAAAAMLPLHVPAWQFLSVRFVPIACCVLVAALPLERVHGTAARRTAISCLVAFAAASTAWAADYNRNLAARSADALSGLDAPLIRNGPRLPIVLDPGLPATSFDPGAMPFAAPLANLGHLYAVAQGGVMPHNFAVNPKLHHILLREGAYRRYPPIPPDLYDWPHWLDRSDPQSDRLRRAAVVTRAARFGAHYQDVILWGRPEDGDLLLHRGYVPLWRKGGLLIAAFEGCPLTVALPPAPALRREGVVELGWYPLEEAALRVRVGGGTRNAAGGIELPIDGAPCGAVWIRLTSRAHRSGAGGPPPGVCDGADAEGRLVVPSTRETPVVECRFAS
jgi:hypothetical protein